LAPKLALLAPKEKGSAVGAKTRKEALLAQKEALLAQKLAKLAQKEKGSAVGTKRKKGALLAQKEARYWHTKSAIGTKNKKKRTEARLADSFAPNR